MSIPGLIPDPDTLLALEPAEIGAVMLEHLNSLPPNERRFSRYNNFGPETLRGYAHDKRLQAAQALMEGWTWLLREVLIMPDPETAQDGGYRLTRRGQALQTRDDVRAYQTARLFPRDLLHRLIAEKAEPPFLRGELDTAVFQAFKEVEVAVRRAAGFGDADFGTELVRKAFHEGTGILTDTNALPAEQQALAHLFAGAIGSYKNPHSHRNVSIGLVEAIEMLILASHLFTIVEARQGRLGQSDPVGSAPIPRP